MGVISIVNGGYKLTNITGGAPPNSDNEWVDRSWSTMHNFFRLFGDYGEIGDGLFFSFYHQFFVTMVTILDYSDYV